MKSLQIRVDIVNIKRLVIKMMDPYRYLGEDSKKSGNIILQLVGLHPVLEELNLVANVANPTNRLRQTYFHLHGFLPTSEQGTHAPMSLKSLTVSSIMVDIDSRIVCHLRSLESLTITHDNNDQSPQTSKQSWTVLRKEGIKLKRIRIHCCDVSAEFLLYLLYCKDTLTTLSLGEPCVPVQMQPMALETMDSVDILAERFYNKVLPDLAPGLEVLQICPAHTPSAWCLDHVKNLAFKRCKTLKELAVSVNSARVQGPCPVTEASDHLCVGFICSADN